MLKTKLQLAEEVHDCDLKELVLHELREQFAREKAKSMKHGSKEAIEFLQKAQTEIGLQHEEKLALAVDKQMIEKYRKEEKE